MSNILIKSGITFTRVPTNDNSKERDDLDGVRFGKSTGAGDRKFGTPQVITVEQAYKKNAKKQDEQSEPKAQKHVQKKFVAKNSK